MSAPNGHQHPQPPPGQHHAYPPQPGQQVYGQPPPGAYAHPPQGAYGHPPPSYAAPMLDPRVKDLNDQSQTWLLVAIIGFWLGFGFVTGPLAWIKAGRLRANYRALGMPASGNATGAWIIGIVSTAVYALTVFAVVGAMMLFATSLSLAAAGT